MAEKITVEIGLDGGAEVERQLDSIGKAGQQAFSEIQSAAEQVNLDSATEQFDNLGSAGQAAFQKVQTAAKSAVAFEQIIQGVRKVEGAFESLGAAATKMAARMTRSLGAIGVLARALGPVGIAVGAVGAAFVKFGDDAADSLSKLTSEGAKLGLTAQQLDGFQQAFGKLGVAPAAVAGGLEKLAEAFGGNLFEGVRRFIEQLERMPDSVQRTQLAIQVLGDSLGSQVIAGLQTGAITAQKFAQALGSVTPATQEQINQANKYQQALGQLGAAWEELKRAFTPIVTPLLGFLAQEIKSLSTDIRGFIIDIKALFGFLQALGGVFTAKGPEQMRAAIQKVIDSYKQLGTGAEQVAKQSQNAFDTTTQKVLQLGQAADQVVAPVKGLFDQVSQAGSDITPVAQQAGQQAGAALAQGISAGVNTAIQEIERLRAAWAAVNGASFASIETMRNGLAQVAADAQNAEKAILRIGDAWVDASGPGHGTPGVGSGTPGVGFAAGGFIGGRGTGTSDSNLAWVSRGEHIMPARAVRQPGVLALLEGLRRSGGNLTRVLDGLGRFALGGLVPRSVPAFAAGGAVGMSNVTIQFPGVQPISGLRASAGVVDELHRAAALAQVRSGGRKPSRYS
jgi:hypothetical protein